MKKTLLVIICLGLMMCVMPLRNDAFDTVTLDNGAEVSIWGYLRNNTGMFTQNPNPWGPTAGQSGNQLAVERTWLRAYGDFKFNEKFRFWIVGQAAYEPWLPVEQGANVMKNGNEYSEYKNVNDVLRETYVEWKPNKGTSIKAGRMNVIWGETITGRVGDVVNPADYRWSLPMSGEAPDDQRIPQYMLRGIHDINMLNSSLEWIISPLLTSPQWGVTRAPDQPANLLAGTAGQRFSPAPAMNFYANQGLCNSAVGGPFSDPNVCVTSPMSGTWSYNPQIFGGNGWGPATFMAFAPPGPGHWANVVTEGAPIVHVKYPDGIKDTRYGFRTNTTAAGFNFGFIYYHRQVFEPVMRREGIVNTVVIPNGAGPGVNVVNLTRSYSVEYPDIDNIGLYMNKQLPWPGVIRTEVMYTPNMAFNTFVPTAQPFSAASGVTKNADLKYLFAYDLNGFVYPSWHKTAPIDFTFEHVGEWIPGASDLQNQVITWYGTKLPQYRAQFIVNAKTNWMYDKFETALAVGYQTFGNGMMMVPSVKWLPGFMNKKFTAELKYIYLDGDRDKDVFGIWKDKSYVQLQTQFTF